MVDPGFHSGMGGEGAAARISCSARPGRRVAKDLLRRTMATRAVGWTGHDRSGRQTRRPAGHSLRQFDRAGDRHVRGDVGRRRRSPDISELFADAGRPGSLAGYRNAASAFVRFRAGQRDLFGRAQDSGACVRDMDCGGSEGRIRVGSVALFDASRRGVRAGLSFDRQAKQPQKSCSLRVRPDFRRASSTPTR